MKISRADSTSPAHSDVKHLIKGARVFCAGRLASMDAEQFDQALTLVGASAATVEESNIAVIGDGLWPLTLAGSENDRLSVLEKLDRRAKGGLVVLGEKAFLEAIGQAHAETTADQQLFSTARLTELLQVSRERVRGWVKAGLLEPVKTEHGVWYFDFRQAAAARTLCDFAAAGVSTDKIRRSLTLLRKFMPDLEHPLEQLAALEKSGKLLVRLAQGDLAEVDGQLHFEFTDTPDTPSSAMRIAPGPTNAAEWLHQGVEQEREGYLEEAAASYRQALLAGGPDAQTCLNLANVLRALGSKPQALERYSQAVEIDPRFSAAWNNMGTLLVELGKADEACVAFRRALAIDPDDLRAHYNLADTLEDQGHHEEAVTHWQAYAKADPMSEWGLYARKRLGC